MNMDNTDNIEADQLHEIVNDGDYEALLAWIENRRPLVFSEPRHPNRSILVAELPIRARISCGNGGRIRQGRARSPRSPTGFPPSPVHQAQRDG